MARLKRVVALAAAALVAGAVFLALQPQSTAGPDPGGVTPQPEPSAPVTADALTGFKQAHPGRASIVVAWEVANSSIDHDIKAQIFSSTGQKVGGVIAVAGGRTNQHNPTVAVNASVPTRSAAATAVDRGTLGVMIPPITRGSCFGLHARLQR